MFTIFLLLRLETSHSSQQRDMVIFEMSFPMNLIAVNTQKHAACLGRSQTPPAAPPVQRVWGKRHYTPQQFLFSVLVCFYHQTPTACGARAGSQPRGSRISEGQLRSLADLSKNRFTEIPPDVWLFAPLETLNLYHNCIKSIPETIKNLQMLTYLNISRNLLATLPKYLFDLPLKVLVVSNNKLVSLPEEIGKLRDLMELICLKGKVHIFKFLSIQECLRIDKKPDSLDLPSLGKRIPSQPLTDSMEDFYPNKNHGPDSGIGSDNGDKRLSTTEPSDDDTISLHSQVSESTREQTLRNDNHLIGSRFDSHKDQEVYDYIDPNTEDAAIPEQGDVQMGPFVSYVKERGKHPEKLQKIEGNDEWGDEKRLQKEQLLAEEDDELKEVTDLRKIAAQLLQQEQKNRRRPLTYRTSFSEKLFQRTRAAGRASRLLNHSTSVSTRNRPKQTVESEKSVSTDETNSPVSPYRWQPLENQKDLTDEQHWPETQPVIWQNEERRRSKQVRKEYFKYKTSRKSSSGNENDEDYERTDSNSHGPFGLKPRSAFSRSSRQDSGVVDPGFTMRRKMEHLREEREQIRHLRNNLESRLKVILPDDIGAALMDGVVLCHLANHIRPRSVASIHVPSPAVERLCLPHHILEERGLVKVGLTVQALLELPSSKASQLSSV
ncbi:leucine-rich repeat and calponin homology domain-containing protein 2 isoform X15 [Chrysemys picta bellii]|uniref:leucine-rich repeat and calponin homology domain-containing protein 2 isoform X15 n=1 Tax=Chrysemys picta bellii TaxID=8478 RepID=UPI0032B2E5BB